MKLLPLSLCVLLVFGAACATEDAVSPADEVPSEVTGLITSIVPSQGSPIESITIEADGTSYEIKIADDVDYGFDLGHLREHLEAEDPVVVTVEQRDGAAVATAIEDVGS
ncbi:MAG: hypothetical protein ACRDKT_15375 [Actinomycetota bacterium]